MNMAGFTADASLGQAKSRYHTPMQTIAQRNGVRIIPQARIIDGFCIGNGSYCCFRDSNGKWTCGKTQPA